MSRLARLSRRAVGLILVVLILLAGLIGWRVSRALRVAREQIRAEHELHVVVRAFVPDANPRFETISAPAVFSQAAQFQGNLYIAGPAGLLEYDVEGVPLHQYAVGHDLPASPLVGMATGVLADSGQQELLLATEQHGVLAFNGRSFRQILPQEADARTITCLLPAASGHLLIGTKKQGVLLYDGKQLSQFHPTLSGIYVTHLAGTESDLWVGTLDRGVMHWSAGQTASFGETQGLPDQQVQSIAIAGDTTFVGTAVGVAEFDHGRFSRVLAPGVFARALLARPAQLLVGTEDDGVIAIPLEGRRPNASLRGGVEHLEIRHLFESGLTIFALAQNGLYRLSARGLGWQQVLQPGAATLSDRNISALAADANGRVWVGYFEHGLDVLYPNEKRATHIENEHVFCVNRIFPDPKTGITEVATANGLVRFDVAASQQQVLTKNDGLIADHVTDVVPYGNGLALATPAGLTFLDATGARSMYAFHGLVNNHVYALGVSGDELMVGTLGGLSALNKGDVRINYTTSTSGLKHNWITAVVPVGDEWMVGTYGAGVMGLDATGRFHAFEGATGPYEVNPNAMLVTSRYVVAGTLGKGLNVYDRESGRWFQIEDGLPSSNVTALALSGGYVYVGTDNGLVRIQEQNLHP